MKLKNISYAQKITLLMALILLNSYLDTTYSKDKEALHYLNIKKVITDNNIKNFSEYENGKLLYPQYKLGGLPENFLIKKTADISLGRDDIKSIKIKKNPVVSNCLYYIIIQTCPKPGL